MRIGVIGYQSRTGIGVMINDFAEKLGAVAQLVIPHDTAEDLAPSNDRRMVHSNTWCPPRDVIAAFAGLVDVAITVESDWGGKVFPILHDKGVKVVLLPMFEWWNPSLPMNRYVDLFICTTMQCYKGIELKNKVFIPCPIDTHKIKYRQRIGKPKWFIHNAGNMGIGGRKGTLEVMRAFTKVKNQTLKLWVNSQVDVSEEIERIVESDQRISLNIKNFDNYEDLYEHGDVLIYTPHYDGQALISAEAMAAGLPVITINAAPMNEHWQIYKGLSAPMFVKVKSTENAQTTNPKSLCLHVDEEALADTIDLAASFRMESYSESNREIAETCFSWDVCLPFYEHYLEAVCEH